MNIKIVYSLFSLFFLFTIFENNLSAQETGNILIQGRVLNQESRQPIESATIREKSSGIKVKSNENGYFTIKTKNANPTLIIQSLGFKQREITAKSNQIEVLLSANTIQIDEVRVSVNRKVDTEGALLETRRKSGIVMDGISAEQIERTASITTTQALQRVVGVTVTDEKYVAVRGLGDRSVIGTMNGSRLASADPNKSSIPLDLIPASLLDNISVLKTYTPDKPADAASGIIDLKTKSIPDTLLFEVIVEGGTNSTIGLNGQVNSFQNSSFGVFAEKIDKKNLSQEFLQLAKQYPRGLSQMQRMISNMPYSAANYQEGMRINSIMQGFDPYLTTKYKRANPNQLYSINFGNRFHLFDKKHELGIILGGNYYRRQTDIYQGQLTQWSIYQGVLTGSDHINSWRNIPNYITPNNLNMGKYQSYLENTGTETLNFGVLAGLGYRFSPDHEIGLQYLGTWGGENTATNMDGSFAYTGLPGDVYSRIYSLKQTHQNLATYNIQGSHKFGKERKFARLNYSFSSSSASHNEPDFRYASLVDYVPNTYHLANYTYNSYYDHLWDDYGSGYPITINNGHHYALTSGYVNGYGPKGVLQAEPNGRRWRNMNERNYNSIVDLTIPFTWNGSNQEIKLGGNYLFRDRVFSENQLFLPGSNFSNTGPTLLYLVNGDLDRLVSNEFVGIHHPEGNMGEGTFPSNGFLYNVLKSPNNYKGYYEVRAFYAMGDIRITPEFRLTGGVRLETTDLGSKVDTSGIFIDPSLSARSSDGLSINLAPIEPNSLYRTGYKPFYALNAVYSLMDGKMNIRGAFNSTLARPEIREITNVFEYDPFQMGLVVGNPNLRNQTTKNLDFRWEWFPNTSEVLAFSAFGKQLKNQLVRVFSLKTNGLASIYPEFPVIRFENESNIGYVWGFELEAVKNLGNIWDRLRYFSIGTNLMLAQSNVRKSDLRYQANTSFDRHSPKNSPLFEQAPYSINGWLNFTNKTWGTDLTCTFNMVGERLVHINLLGEPDLYARPVPMLDIVWSQKIGKKLLFKGFAKNALDPAIKTVYANPGTGGKWYGNEYIQRSYFRGTEIMVGFTYKLL